MGERRVTREGWCEKDVKISPPPLRRKSLIFRQNSD